MFASGPPCGRTLLNGADGGVLKAPGKCEIARRAAEFPDSLAPGRANKKAQGGVIGGTHLAWAQSYCPDYRNLPVT